MIDLIRMRPDLKTLDGAGASRTIGRRLSLWHGS